MGGRKKKDDLLNDNCWWIHTSLIYKVLFVVVLLLSHVQMFANTCNAAHQASLSFTISTAYSKSCPLSCWCHPTISFSVVPFSSCLQSFQASGSFLMSWLILSGGHSIGASATVSVLPMNIQNWFSLGWTGWISCSPRDSQESAPIPQFKSINSMVLSLLYVPTFNIRTWLLEKP